MNQDKQVTVIESVQDYGEEWNEIAEKMDDWFFREIEMKKEMFVLQ